MTPEVIVVIPTLAAGPPLARAVRSLQAQTANGVSVVVFDNSGEGFARLALPGNGVDIVESASNVGFGEAINMAARERRSTYVAVLNDDASAEPEMLERLMVALDADERAGMAAPRIALSSSPDRLDSAGLSVYLDGVAKQRGHRRPVRELDELREAFLPSGCAAMYRRAMLDEIGWFDADYFLYGEDTDVGLRGRLAGWTCLYVPQAHVAHDYSGTAGRASRLKAFYVERNRLWNVVKNFPFAMWPGVPWYSAVRYWAHFRASRSGAGLAGESIGVFGLAAVVASAYWGTIKALPNLLGKRREFADRRKLSGREFRALFDRFRISAREIAEQ